LFITSKTERKTKQNKKLSELKHASWMMTVPSPVFYMISAAQRNLDTCPSTPSLNVAGLEFEPVVFSGKIVF
jgi:hypothetical protein